MQQMYTRMRMLPCVSPATLGKLRKAARLSFFCITLTSHVCNLQHRKPGKPSKGTAATTKRKANSGKPSSSKGNGSNKSSTKTGRSTAQQRVFEEGQAKKQQAGAAAVRRASSFAEVCACVLGLEYWGGVYHVSIIVCGAMA